MKEVLDPLTSIAGVRTAALVSKDGMPIAHVSREADGEEDFSAMAALVAGWYGDVERAAGSLAWAAPQRAVLRAGRGALVVHAAPGALLLVVLEPGVSPEELRVPIEGAIARMQRILRGMGTADKEPTTLSGIEYPRGPLPADKDERRSEEDGEELARDHISEVSGDL